MRGQTNVDLKSAEGSWLDRFMAFLSGDEPVRAAFTKMGFTDEESTRYYNEVKNGNILLYVDQEYGRNFTETGYVGGVTDPNLGGNLTVEDEYTQLDNELANEHRHLNNDIDLDMDEEKRLRLHEEKLNVDKQEVKTGEVNIGKHVVEEEQTVEVPVTREEVEIERRPVHDETAAGVVFEDEDSIHIPVREERIEVTKRPIVNEEIVVHKREVEDTETVSETVRREEADIDRTDNHLNDLEGDLHLNNDRTRRDPFNDRDKL